MYIAYSTIYDMRGIDIEPRLAVTPILRDKLTVTQTEILEGVINGACRKRIARDRGISPKTVDAHIDNTLGRLGDLVGIKPPVAELVPFLVHRRLVTIEDPERCNNCPLRQLSKNSL